MVLTSVSDFFEKAEDELLVEIAMYYPKQLKFMCTMLSLELQLKEEAKKKKQKKTKRL